MEPQTQTNEWTNVRGQIKTKFGKFSDTEIDSLNGHMDLLSEKVQKTYGYDKSKADLECKTFTESLNRKVV